MARDDVPAGERVDRSGIDADEIAARGATDPDPLTSVADPAVGARSGESRAGRIGADVVPRDDVSSPDDLDPQRDPGDDVPLELVVHAVAVGPDLVRLSVIMDV